MADRFLQNLRRIVAGIKPWFGSESGFGYSVGSTVTQATDKTTAFTLDKLTGRIIFASGALAAFTASSATWTNSFIGSYDTISFTQNSGTIGKYNFQFICSAGQAQVIIYNASNGSLNEAVAISFNIHKGSWS